MEKEIDAYTRLCRSLRFATKSCSKISVLRICLGEMHVAGAAPNAGMEATHSQHLGNLWKDFQNENHYIKKVHGNERAWQWYQDLRKTPIIFRAVPPSDILLLRLMTFLSCLACLLPAELDRRGLRKSSRKSALAFLVEPCSSAVCPLAVIGQKCASQPIALYRKYCEKWASSHSLAW